MPESPTQFFSRSNKILWSTVSWSGRPWQAFLVSFFVFGVLFCVLDSPCLLSNSFPVLLWRSVLSSSGLTSLPFCSSPWLLAPAYQQLFHHLTKKGEISACSCSWVTSLSCSLSGVALWRLFIGSVKYLARMQSTESRRTYINAAVSIEKTIVSALYKSPEAFAGRITGGKKEKIVKLKARAISKRVWAGSKKQSLPK